MEIKNNLNFLQNEAKHLLKLKNLDENMANNYQNNVFPTTIEKYYQNKLSLIFIQSIDTILKKDSNKKDLFLKKKVELNKDLLTIESSQTFLGSYYQEVSDFFISLRNNEKIISYLIENVKGESQNLLINYLSLLFYDNALEINNNNISQEKNSEEIVLNKILVNLIEKELEEVINNGNNYSKFLDGTLASKIIKNFLKKKDVQKYLRNIFYDIIIDITEMENKNVFMEPNRIRDYLQKNGKLENLIVKEEKEEPQEDVLSAFKNKNVTEKKKLRGSMMPPTIMSKESDDILLNSVAFNLNKNKMDFQDISNGYIDINNTTDFDKLLGKNNIGKSTYARRKPLSYFTSKNIETFLYEDITHSRLIYGATEQKNYFNYIEEDNNCYHDYYKPINIDKFLEIKAKKPENNDEYYNSQLSENELNIRIKANNSNKFMEEFYSNQLNVIKNDPKMNYSNKSFIKLLKKNYLLFLEEIIPQYKKNFEKIKYFIDKMIYKMLMNKNEEIPIFIKNIINTIKNYLIKKDKNIGQIEVNRYIFEFFIGKIIIPFLTNDELINLIIGKKIDIESKTFLFYYAKIIKKIFRSNFYDSFEQHFTIFNIYLTEILPYINSIIVNITLDNNNYNNELENKNNNQINNGENSQLKSNINNILNYDTMIINEKLLNIILEALIKNNNNENEKNLDVQKLFEGDKLEERLKLISGNYNDIIQQIKESKETLNSNSDIDDNIFGGLFFILKKEEISKQKKEIISLTSDNIQKNNFEILPKIKYSLIKMLELIPSKIFIQNQQLLINKTLIEIFSEIKNILAKDFINNFTNENNKLEKESNISFIWYFDYFLNYYDYLSEDYKINEFEKLFQEIQDDIKNEILLYQNDLSEYSFSIIIDNLNKKINSMNDLFEVYNENTFVFKIKKFTFNSIKIKTDIYEYSKEDKKFIFLNKLANKDIKEITFIKNATIENIKDLINYLSNHIINENILEKFSEIEKNSPKNFSQINNINIFLDEYLIMIREYIIKEINQQINNENDIEEKEKETIEKIMNTIEEIIHEGIYDKIWKNKQTEEDIKLNEICINKLYSVTTKELGINEKYINKHVWKNILDLMKTKYNIDNYKTPMKKIKCVENIYNILNKSINVITNKINRYSVDDIFPIFVYLIINAKPEYYVSNLNFIRLLIRKKNLIKSSGFALIQLEMAIQYLQNMETDEKI